MGRTGRMGRMGGYARTSRTDAPTRGNERSEFSHRPPVTGHQLSIQRFRRNRPTQGRHRESGARGLRGSGARRQDGTEVAGVRPHPLGSGNPRQGTSPYLLAPRPSLLRCPAPSATTT
jgi:hypothetical protein